MSPDAMRAVVARYYDCVDANDVEGLLALFSAEAEYRRPGYDPLVGRDALDDFYRNRRVIASGRHTITNLVCDGARVAVEGTFSGVLKDGSQSEVRFADFYRFGGALFTHRITYFYAPLV